MYQIMNQITAKVSVINLSAIALTTTVALFASSADAYTLGGSSGIWSNPVGGSNIETGTYGGYDTILWGGWGENAPLFTKNALGYKGKTDVNFGLGEAFQVGHIKHYNSLNPSRTPLDGVDLSIDLDFDLPDFEKTLDFNLTVDETLNVKKFCFIRCITVPFPVPDRVDIDPAFISSTIQTEDQKYRVDFWFGTLENVRGKMVTPEGFYKKRKLWAKVETVPEPTTILGLLTVGLLGMTLKRKH